MWFKNSVNTFNRPTKLLRLDSTGERSKDQSEYCSEVRVTDPKDLTGKVVENSGFNFWLKDSLMSLGLMGGNGSSCSLMNSSIKLTNREQTVPMVDVDSVKMMYGDMIGHQRPKINVWGSWPNHARTPRNNRNGFTNERQYKNAMDYKSQRSFKVPQDSPWLRVNSGYFHFQPYSGSYNFNFLNSGNKNGFCDNNNSSNHKINTKHKKELREKNSKGSGVDPKSLITFVSDTSKSVKLSVSDDSCTPKTLVKPLICEGEINKVNLDVNPSAKEDSLVNKTNLKSSNCNDCDISVSGEATENKECLDSESISFHISGDKSEGETLRIVRKEESQLQDSICSKGGQTVAKEVDLDASESGVKIYPSTNLVNRLDSCVADLFKDDNSEKIPDKLSKNNSKSEVVQQKQGSNSTTQVQDSESSKAANNSAIISKTKVPTSSRTFHLSIIGGKCQSKEKTSLQSSNSSHSKHDPSDSDLLKGNCDEKAAQDKNCSLCTAYLNRVTPECKDFPKSAGCKHSLILLVRGSSKKTKKRQRPSKEKSKTAQRKSPKSVIVGVNSIDSPDNSHIFEIIPRSVSDSEDSWDSYDDEEDEIDGASCDWSKVKMDDLFPTSNCLFNPMNFKVHISPAPNVKETGSETSDSPCDPSSINKHLEAVNLAWNIQVDEKSNDASSLKTKPQKKVRFVDEKNLAKVYPMVAWSYAYRASRKGPWEQYARDRERFHRRIQDSEKVLSKILAKDLRSKIYNSLYCERN